MQLDGTVPRRWASAFAVAAVAVAAAAWLQTDARLSAAQVRASKRAVSTAAAATARPAPMRALPFTERLPVVASSEPVLRELQRAVQSAGVTLGQVDVSAQPSTADTLGRLQITASMRGSYAGIKSVLASSLARFPHVVLRRLSLQLATSGGGEEIDASFELLVLSRPLPDGGS